MILKSKPVNPMKGLLSGVAMLPSTGEQVYSTKVYTFNPEGEGDNVVMNRRDGQTKSDFTLAIELLKQKLPSVDWISLVVSWFGNDLRIGECIVEPKTESNTGVSTPHDWLVSGIARADASVPSTISDGGDSYLAYGGTPSDNSVVQGIKYLKSKGYKVMFYPFILMDIPEGNELPDPYGGDEQGAHPWRGRITMMPEDDVTSATTTAVNTFFGSCVPADFKIVGERVDYSGPNELSFRRMILHYANLCKAAGGVDAFCVGTEMVGLTQARSAQTTFPAVNKLIALLKECRQILGKTCELTYASDWSEFTPYQPQDGTGDLLHPLDPLWMSTYCDFIGIDNYIPLSDWRDGAHLDDSYGSIYNTNYLIDNIEGGEGYDWYYASQEDRDDQTRSAAITDWNYRFKDHRGWWLNEHFTRLAYAWPGTQTVWVPESKRIVYTEFGCAAIHRGTNQPNKFLDPKSSESVAPYYSNESRDDKIQQKYYEAMVTYWRPENGANPVSSITNEHMIDTTMMFAWAWDGRPYPWFPALSDTWADSENYPAGHWLMGRSWTQ